MKRKTFRLQPEEIQDLAPNRGSCIASDKVTVDGERVRYMYREEPDNDTDSGWRFFSGSETQEYADDADHFAIYDVNTIANYDSDVIPFLDSPVGSAFERDASGTFVAVDFPGDPDDG